MKPTYILALIIFILIAIGCGGSGTASPPTTTLAPAGTVTYHGTVTASSTSSATVTDPVTGASVTIPSGAMQVGSKLELKVWSGQRSFVALSNFKPSTRAFDLTLDLSKLTSTGHLTIQLPWQNPSGQFIAIMAFDGKGGFFPLLTTPNSAGTSISASISSDELSGLATTSGSTTLTFAVEEVVPPPAATNSTPHSLNVPGALKPPTTYAGRQRIGIVVHGLFGETSYGPGLYTAANYADSGSYMIPVLALLSAAPGLPTDGATSQKSAPFDACYAFEYNTKLGIEVNGNLLSGQIKANFGNQDKFEVHIIAHSMGGLVSRWAIEQNSCPSVTQLITLGTPHQGVPYDLLDTLGTSLAVGAISRGKGSPTLPTPLR